jgi:transcriptional regulator with XRE-family HTH domain
MFNLLNIFGGIMRLSEIGQRIREQRRALGLTQEQLARLSELSRTTINQMENGTLVDLGYTKLSNLLSLLGLDLHAQPATGLNHALEVAARTASTSYKKTLGPEKLAEMLTSGEAPDEYRPHLMTLLDETPLPVVIKAIQEAAQRSPTATPRKMIRHLAKWADELHSYRRVW